MEVHTHTHTPRKKWTHYLWEFLMLFLAVFCGFLAENQREHMVEHQREKEYMKSLVQDLNADVKDINTNFEIAAKVTPKLDSLIYFLNNGDPDKDANSLYRLAPLAGRIVQVSFNDRTASQLKNAGNMRLIRNSNLSDSIQDYWTHIKINEAIADRIGDIQSKAADIAVQIFNNKYYEKRNPLTPFVVNVRNDAKLINSDPKLLAQLSNWANNRLYILYNYLNNLRDTKEMALGLIELIRKEYHFE